MKSALMGNYGSPELEFERGQGCYLYTVEGDKYLDFAMGIAVNCLGHCHPSLVNALCSQAEKLWHTSNLYRISQAERLAQRLTEFTFAEQVFFGNSGAEAIECGFKMIRRYQHDKGRPKSKRIITVSESFHGRTLASIAASANPLHTEGFLVGDSGFDQVLFGDEAAMSAAVTEETAGIVIEPIQGEGGIRTASKSYLAFLRELCNKQDLLLMFDEIQCGLARTGSLFAYQQLEVTPDILASAKGLGGGFPIGACLSTQRASAAMVAGTHGSTFGGNPLACAVSNAVLDEITNPGFMAALNTKSSYIRVKLQEMVERFPSMLRGITGTGLMIGIRCGINNGELITELTKNRLLTVKAGDNSIRFLPPLNVQQNEIDEALTILASVLENWQK